MFLKYSYFEKNVLLLPLSINFLQAPSLDGAKFYIAKFNYLIETPNKVKERFSNVFDWPLCW